MAQITDLGEVRQKRKRKRARKGLLLILVILLLTALLSFVFSSRSEYGFSSFLDLFEEGEGWPVEAPGGKSKGMYQLDGLLCISNDTDLLMYNSKGGEAYAVKHQMADPHLAIREDKLLLFDQGARSYALYQKNVPLVDSETAHVLYTGAVSAKGLFALATRSEDYLSQVTVYDQHGALQYSWNYSDKVVTALALSPSGSKLAVCGLYAEEGSIRSQLLLYDKGELVDSRTFDDAVICSLTFVGETELKGVTDQGAFLISDKGKLMGEYDYKSQPLAAYCNTPEATVLLLGDYRQEGGYQLISLNGDMNRRSSASIKGNIHVLKADSSSAYLLAGSSYYQVDLASGQILVQEEAEYIYDLQPLGKGVFAVTNGEIVRMEQVKAEERDPAQTIVPEQTKPEEELEDWERPSEEAPVEEAPAETPPAPEEEPVVEPEELPEAPKGTLPGEPGL